MKRIIYLFFSVFLTLNLSGQDRYLDEIFDVEITRDIVYGANIDVLFFAQGLNPVRQLMVDVYSPQGDTEVDRPLILITHTGTFLPTVINRGATGNRGDSSVVEVAKRLARRGYVAAIFEYRQGWLATSTLESERLATILQAAYRGIVDARTVARYFRKTIADENNPYGINPDKFGIYGIGTGGYLAVGAATLDRFEEVTLEKFRDPVTLAVLIDTTIIGNFEGTNVTDLAAGGQNIPNHVGFSSDYQFSFNAGGALGDTSWIENKPNEPFMCGVHCTQDAFAPFWEAIVREPINQGPIIEVAGTRLAVEVANLKGTNSDLIRINPADDPLSALIEEQKITLVTTQLGLGDPKEVTLGTDHFYGFDIPIIFNGVQAPQGSPWDWWGFEDLENLVEIENDKTDDRPFNALDIHNASLATNPDMSAEKGRAYIDTMFMLTDPRMYAIFDLGDAVTSSEDIIEENEVGLSLYPNPVLDQVRFTSDGDTPIGALLVFDSAGRQVYKNTNVNSNDYTWYRNGLSSGIYVVKVHFEDGVVAKRLYLE